MYVYDLSGCKNLEEEDEGIGESIMNKSCHKLVRDRIPEIIEADGKVCTWETHSQEEYLSLLDEKLNEELAEYQESKSLEELADLLEVIQSVVRTRGWTLEQLEQLRADKAARSGGFEKRILLTSVRKKEDYRYLLVMRISCGNPASCTPPPFPSWSANGSRARRSLLRNTCEG